MKNIKRQKTEPTKQSQYESLEDIEQAFDLFTKDFNREFHKYSSVSVTAKNQQKNNGTDDRVIMPRKISANMEENSQTNKIIQDPKQIQTNTQNSSSRANSYILTSTYSGAKSERKSSRMSQMDSKLGINQLPASMRVRFQENNRRDSRASCSSQDSVRLSNRLYSQDGIKEIPEKQNPQPQQVKIIPQGANVVKRKPSKTQLSYFSKAQSPQKENGQQIGTTNQDTQQKTLDEVKSMAIRINRKSSRLSNSSDIRGGWENPNAKMQVSQGNLDKINEKQMGNSSSSCNQEVMPVISSDLATFALAFNYVLKGNQSQSNLNNLLSQKLLSTFGISRLQLEGIKGEEEKKEFIVKELTARIKEQYEQWQSRSETRNQDILKSEDELLMKLQKRTKRTDKVKSQFEWMKVNTKYAALESTLKSTLIMKINDFYNQSFLQDKILQNKVNQQFNNLSQDASEDIESFREIETVPVVINARKNGEKYQSLKVTPIKSSQGSQENFSNKRTTDTTPIHNKGDNLGESFVQNHKQVYAEQIPEKRENKGSNNNSIVFNIPLRQIEQQSSRTIMISKSQPDLSLVPSTSSFFGKVNQNDQARNQAPLLNLMEEIQLRRMNTSESPLRRMRQKTIVVNQTNQQQLKDGYNSKLNKYIQMKQSQGQTSNNSSKSVAEMKDKIESCLLEGKQTSDEDLTYEYRWLKEGMIKGINQSESQHAQKQLLTNNFYWNQETEDMFLKKRNIKAAINFHQVKANNFNSLATYEFMRLLIKNQATQAIDRENLLSKFRRGEVLDEEQMNFLAATSELLNKFVDKQFIEEAMHILETNGIVDTVELVLAENILKSYSTIKSILDHHRDVFLVRKNEYALMRLKETEQNDKDAKQFLEKCKAFRKKATMFRTVLKSMAEKQRNQQKSLQERSQINSSRMQSGEGNSEGTAQKNEIILCQKQKITKISLLHPSSRLLMKDPRAKTPTKQEDKDTLKKNASKWFSKEKNNRQQLKSQESIDHYQKKFLKFYSGGPSQGQKNEINQATRLKAVIRIQSYVRMNLARKRYLDTDFLKQQKLMHIQEDIQGQVQEQQVVVTNNRPSNYLPSEQYDNEDGIFNSIDIDSASYVGLLPHRNQSEAQCFEEKRRKSRLHSTQKIKQSPADTFKNAVIQKINQLRQKKAENAEKNQNWRGRAAELIQGAKENSILKVRLEGLNLRQGDVNVQDARSNTALYYSIMNNNLLLAKFLLQRGANPNLQCEELNTPLHIAFKQNNILLILELLNNGANVYLKNCKGYTPVDLASEEILQHEHVKNAVQRSKQNNHEPFFGARSSFILNSSIVQNQIQ